MKIDTPIISEEIVNKTKRKMISLLQAMGSIQPELVYTNYISSVQISSVS